MLAFERPWPHTTLTLDLCKSRPGVPSSALHTPLPAAPAAVHEQNRRPPTPPLFSLLFETKPTQGDGGRPSKIFKGKSQQQRQSLAVVSSPPLRHFPHFFPPLLFERRLLLTEEGGAGAAAWLWLCPCWWSWPPQSHSSCFFFLPLTLAFV